MTSSEKHIHSYDEDGNVTCCSLGEKINMHEPTAFKSNVVRDDQSHDHDHAHAHDGWRSYLPALVSFVLLITGLVLEHVWQLSFFTDYIKLAWYIAAYIPVGFPVLRAGWTSIKNGQVFTEFFLMSIATIGAFIIGEYPEGVAVMLFYAVGELFQTAAVRRAKGNIRALLDLRPNVAHVLRGNHYVTTKPEEVAIGEIIQIKVGEKIPLDGTLISSYASLNNAALTGESKPEYISQGNHVMAGSINLKNVINVRVNKLFEDSSIARILELVEHATTRKSKTELLIRRLAKIYTPIVTYLAMAICFLPIFFVDDYVFSDWLYRALIFLVISCPCALVISIPLGYFGGLGAASKNGILFKGATFLDQLTKVNTLILDKTGTVTKGIFKVKKIYPAEDIDKNTLMRTLMALESKSNHPVARAIMACKLEGEIPKATEITEIAGKGLQGIVEGELILAGNKSLLQQFNIETPGFVDKIVESLVLVAIENKYAGCLVIADELKEDAKASIETLKKMGIREIIMLSGDQNSITKKVAKELGIKSAKGGLLPEDKLHEVETLKKDKNKIIAFVGDGINDAPILAASDVGIAMGGLGSDVAIETADVIIQTDQPSKIIAGIKIGKAAQRIIWQNIYLAFGVKILVLVGGAFGMATMWQAVFADVGVALLAILNAVRIGNMKMW